MLTMEITDPRALDSLYFLQGIQPGDEIHACNWHPTYKVNGKWLRVAKVEDGMVYAALPRRMISLCDGTGDTKWETGRRFLDGWRRR